MELIENLKSGDTETYQPYEMPDSAMGSSVYTVSCACRSSSIVFRTRARLSG